MEVGFPMAMLLGDFFGSSEEGLGGEGGFGVCIGLRVKFGLGLPCLVAFLCED